MPKCAVFISPIKADPPLKTKGFGEGNGRDRGWLTSSRVETIKPTTDRSLFFIHIHKTGGTTLRELIEQRFEPHALCPDEYMMRRSGGNYPEPPWYLNLPAEQFDKIRLLRGHLHFLAHKRFPERPFITTIFREPTERTISELRYLVRMAGKPLEAETEMVEAVVRDGVPEEFRNVQTKYFRGDYALDQLARDPLPDRGARPTLAEFDQARARVASLDLVGVQSRLQAFARALFDHFGWGAPPDAPRRNAAAAPLRFSPLALQMIKDANQYDYQLYQDACARSE